MNVLKAFMVALILCFPLNAAFAAQDTPKSILKNKFYKSLTKVSKEQKFPLVMKNLHTRLNSQYTSKKDLNAAMFWLRDEYLYNDGDPKYGLSYVQFLESISRSLKDTDQKQSHTLKLNSVIHYFVSEHFLLSDIAYCADDTAGVNSRAELQKIRQNHLRRFSALTQTDKEEVYKGIFQLIDERKARKPYTDICKSGQMHMQKALQTGQYKEDFTVKDGTKYIDDNLAPDLLDSATWQKLRNGLYNTLQNDLLSLQ